jgi:hypothetical protein
MKPDDFDEIECPTCGLQLSGCTCNRQPPSEEELEASRAQRLTQAERSSLRKVERK